MDNSSSKDINAILSNAIIHHKNGKLDQAEDGYTQIISIEQDHAVATQLLGTIALQKLQYGKAQELLTKAIQLNPNSGIAQHNLARLYEALGELERAAKHYQRAFELMPSNADTSYSLAGVLTSLGQFADSERWYRQTLALNPGYASAHRQLARLLDHQTVDADIVAMETLINDGATQDSAKVHLAFGLGKAYEDIGDYEQAFDFYATANRLKRQQLRFDINDWDKEVDKTIAAFSEELFERVSPQKFLDRTSDAQPIFILGMPRSGTSLLEQILASHSQVYGGGELQTLNLSIMGAMDVNQYPNNVAELTVQQLDKMATDYLSHTAHISGNADYISDKKPDNFKLVGMIKLIFPNAIVIHSCRNPIDNCLSLYKNHFSENGPFYSYDQTELGRYYRGYRRLMEHWQTVLPGFVHDIHYEKIVADVESGTKQLLANCQLDFEPACLEFHHTKRTVKTASAAQVRKSIYASSVELWRQYEDQLKPLLDALKGSS